MGRSHPWPASEDCLTRDVCQVSALCHGSFPRPQMTGSLEHRCRKSQSHATTSPDMLGSAFFQRGGILWKRCGGCQSSSGNLLKNDLNLILILSTLLSPQIILQCKRFPAAFGESPRSVPTTATTVCGLLELVNRAWVSLLRECYRAPEFPDL